MRIDVVTLFKEMFVSPTQVALLRRAIDAKLCELFYWNPRDYAEDKQRTVDSKPYGGGAGMLLKPEPLCRCIDDIAKQTSSKPVVIALSPRGVPLTQGRVVEFSQLPHLALVAGRYEGIDERILISRVDYEVSIGDFVLAGGELAAMALIEAMVRLLPGALGNNDSLKKESFSHGVLEYPQYTRPEIFEGMQVPQVLLSGNHQAIDLWRQQSAAYDTKQRRPDLLNKEQYNRN